MVIIKCQHVLSFLAMMNFCFNITTTYASYGSKLCKQPGFNCIRVKQNQSWRSLFPDSHDRSIAMRLNRMNTQIWEGMTIAVPDNIESADMMEFSPFPLEINSPKEKLIVIDPLQLAWGAYDSQGALVRWGPISAGADYCKDTEKPCYTHAGSFRIFSLGSSDCYSTLFPLPDGGAPMPYCMYFNNGQALHGEPNGLPGYNASHGCVRLYVNDAAWLRYDFVEPPNENNHFRGTKVLVKSYYNDLYDEDKEEEWTDPDY